MTIVRSYRLWLPVILGVQLVLASVSSGEEKRMKPGEAAVVNGKPIPVTELERNVDAMAKQMASKGQTPDPAQMAVIRSRVLEELIGIELLAQEGRKKGIKVEEVAVDNRLKALKSSFPSEEMYQEALSRDRISESDLKKKIEQGLLIQELVSREVIQKISVSAEESKAFYDSHPDAFKQPEQVHASHILIKVDPKGGNEAKKKARKEIEDILNRVKKGEDFAGLAKQYSQCPSNAKGGDLGFMGRGQTVKPFEDAAFSLKAGEMSGIVETEFGFHIVRVMERRQERKVPYEEAKDALEKHLKDSRIKEEVGRYVGNLRANSKVEKSTEP
jgi:peptidyl-prolyl cis-trans isomerase C